MSPNATLEVKGVGGGVGGGGGWGGGLWVVGGGGGGVEGFFWGCDTPAVVGGSCFLRCVFFRVWFLGVFIVPYLKAAELLSSLNYLSSTGTAGGGRGSCWEICCQPNITDRESP